MRSSPPKRILPSSGWTIPEIASVGYTEDQLRARGLSYEVGRASFRANARGQIIGDLEGLVKLVFDPADQRLLGVSIVGEGATELIHIGQAVINLSGTVDFFVNNTFNYPTLAEAYKIAGLDAWNRMGRG